VLFVLEFISSSYNFNFRIAITSNILDVAK